MTRGVFYTYFFYKKKGGKIPIRKYISPKIAAVSENISQVSLKENMSLSLPPLISPIIEPIEHAMLKAANDLSLMT